MLDVGLVIRKGGSTLRSAQTKVLARSRVKTRKVPYEYIEEPLYPTTPFGADPS